MIPRRVNLVDLQPGDVFVEVRVHKVLEQRGSSDWPYIRTRVLAGTGSTDKDSEWSFDDNDTFLVKKGKR